MRSNPSSDQHLQQHAEQGRTLGYLLREAYGVLQEQVYAAVATAGHPGLRAMHSPVLRHLLPSGGRVADLARATGLAKQSAAYVVKDLIELGYLRTEPDLADGRAQRITYTARGHKLLAALMSASRDAEATLAARLGHERLRLLRDTLQTVLSEPPDSQHSRRAALPRRNRRQIPR
jgi:DNA-binding MarR family transcriptional regulator